MSTEETSPFDILLVEDEAADACLVKLALREVTQPSRLHHVLDGSEALAFLRKQEPRYADAPRPRLVLLDLNMPRMNGREFLQRLRTEEKRFIDIPVVVFSTSEYERDKESCYALGANDFVTKPVDIDEFIAAVKGIGQRWFPTGDNDRKGV
jgi:CheY-like chemotaxis protein